MGETEAAAPNIESAEAPKMNFVQRMTGIYFEPKKTFEDVHRKGSWLGMFIIVSVLVMTTSYLIISRIDPQTLMRKGLEQSPFTRNMSEEQIQRILSQPVSPIRFYLQVALAPAGVMIAYLIVSGVLLLIFVLMGASLTYKKSLAITVWGMGPPAIVVFLLSIIFILVKEPDSLDLNATNNVVSNLGVAVGDKEHPVLHSLLSSLDVFSFWTIFLLATGFSAAPSIKLTTGKAAVGVLIVWGVYVAGKVGISAIFS